MIDLQEQVGKIWNYKWLFFSILGTLILFYLTRTFIPELYGVAIALLSGFVAVGGFIFIDELINGQINTFQQIKARNTAYAYFMVAEAIVYAVAYAITFIAFLG